MKFFSHLALWSSLVRAGCANKSTTDIPLEDAGQAFQTRYGTVLSHRPVSVRSDSTQAVGGGAFLGGAAGAVIGQTNGAMLGGLVLGGVAGELAHDLIETDNAIEYVIAFGDGKTMIIAQIQRGNEPVLQKGTRVLVQFGAKSNRVISAEDLEKEIEPPQELRLKTQKPIKPPQKEKISPPRGSSTAQSSILQN
jgi:outer membrane lipoprotein SlyB